VVLPVLVGAGAGAAQVDNSKRDIRRYRVLYAGAVMDLDLSIEGLARACKGNVKNLPSFMVHDNDVWPDWRRIRVDNRNRIHLRRSAFEAVVAGKLPIRAGIWHRVDVQEFHLDRQPHHLQGSDLATESTKRAAARTVARADGSGRVAGDDGYGERDEIRTTRAAKPG